MQKAIGPSPTWIGPYQTLQEAKLERASLASSANESLFDTHSWLGRQGDFAKRLSSELAAGLDNPLPRSSSLPLLTAAHPSTRIIDLGGGAAWPYKAISTFCSVDDYVVIDREEVCVFFRERIAAPVRYLAMAPDGSLSLDALRHGLGSVHFDIVYANSACQYAFTNQLLADIVREARPRWVLLDDVPVAQGQRDAFALQVNSDCPEIVRFLSVQELGISLGRLGYRLSWRMAFAQPGHVNWIETRDPSTIPAVPQPETLLFLRGA